MKANGRDPVDISTGKAQEKPGEAGAKKEPARLPRTAAGFLERLSMGDSIEAACAAVGVKRAAYEQWRVRYEGFPEAVEAAREQHQHWVRGGLMEDDAYAMKLFSRIMRDENQPVLRRQRAATQILNRRGKREWVPEGIPAGAKPLQPWDGFVVEEEGAPGTGAGYRGTVRQADGWEADRRKGPEAGTVAHDGNGEESPEKGANGVGEAVAKEAISVETVAANAVGAGASTECRVAGDKGVTAPKQGTLHTADSAEPPASHEDAAIAAGEPRSEGAASPVPAANLSERVTPNPACEQGASPPPSATSSAAIASQDRGSNLLAAQAKPRKPDTVLTDAWLSATFLHKHESREAFERLFGHHLQAYTPATPQEELLTFRVTQKAWILRRLDTLERVISDSAVTKVRMHHPNAAPAACIAMMFLEVNETEETQFQERIGKLRREHEAMHERLESKLQTLQKRREAREDRQRGGPRLGGQNLGGLSGSKQVVPTPRPWQAVSAG